MKGSNSIWLKSVTVWNPDGVTPAVDVEIQDGRVKAIVPGGSLCAPPEVAPVNCTDLVLLPAGVDPQVHLRVPGQPEKETALTGLQAAVGGGVAVVLTMPNTKPVIDDLPSFQQAQRELADAAQRTGVTPFIAPAISKGQKGKEPVDFFALARAGARAFTDDGVGVVADEVMAAAFRASAELQVPILQHAEFPGHGGVLASGPVQEKLGIKPYPASAEVDMVERDLRLLRDFPEARYHVLHVSSLATLDLIRKAKDGGLRATCEVSPHHLLFTAADIDESNPAFKMNPPLRSAQDRQALRQGLADGTIDFVATDHAPHEPAAKTANLKTSAFGTTGLEASLKVLNTLRQEGYFDAKRLVQVFSTRPAEFLGIYPRYGEIVVGEPLYGVLFAPDTPAKPFELPREGLRSQSGNSCFLGSPLRGTIRAVHFGNQWVPLEGSSIV